MNGGWQGGIADGAGWTRMLSCPPSPPPAATERQAESGRRAAAHGAGGGLRGAAGPSLTPSHVRSCGPHATPAEKYQKSSRNLLSRVFRWKLLRVQSESCGPPAGRRPARPTVPTDAGRRAAGRRRPTGCGARRCLACCADDSHEEAGVRQARSRPHARGPKARSRANGSRTGDSF